MICRWLCCILCLSFSHSNSMNRSVIWVSSPLNCVSGCLSSSSKDGSKRFGCHLCSNIVKCSRNGAVNDRDRAQHQARRHENIQLSWKSGDILRRQVFKSGAEPYATLMLLNKAWWNGIRHFQVLIFQFGLVGDESQCVSTLPLWQRQTV